MNGEWEDDNSQQDVAVEKQEKPPRHEGSSQIKVRAEIQAGVGGLAGNGSWYP